MRTKILAATFALGFFLFIAPVSNAQMSKEGTDDGTCVFTVTSKQVALDKDRFAITFEFFGVYLSDTGKGPFHNMSTHSVGAIYFDRGAGKALGWISMTALDGAKVFVEIKEDVTRLPPSPNNGTGIFLGGTGKFEGIEGKLEYSRYYTRPSKEGVGQEVAKMKFSWKLSETKQ